MQIVAVNARGRYGLVLGRRALVNMLADVVEALPKLEIERERERVIN